MTKQPTFRATALLLTVLAGVAATSAQWWLRRKAYPRLYAPLRILILTDIHYGEFEGEFQGTFQDTMSTTVTESLIAGGKPNFVVVLGDIVTGESLRREGNPIKFVRAMLQPMLSAGVPFASTYGNHDISRNLSRVSMLSFEQRLPRSYTQRQTPASIPGLTNYVIPVFSRLRGQPMVAQLVFLDSGGITGLGVPQVGVNWVTAQQVTWFRRVLAARPGIPTYVFVHIPLPQFQVLQDSFVQNGCVGLRKELQLATQDQDQGLWDALMENEQVVGVFSGHNHGSGWCCRASRGPAKRPLAACFARHSGFGGYGGDWAKAGRLISIPAVRSFRLNTWVRMTDDTIADRFLA